MKRIIFTIVAFVMFGVLIIGTDEALAGKRDNLECELTWKPNPEKNIRDQCLNGLCLIPKISKYVRPSELERILAMGEVYARVSSPKGDSCVFNHPENIRVDVTVTKIWMQADKEKRQPSCYELKAVMNCRRK